MGEDSMWLEHTHNFSLPQVTSPPPGRFAGTDSKYFSNIRFKSAVFIATAKGFACLLALDGCSYSIIFAY